MFRSLAAVLLLTFVASLPKPAQAEPPAELMALLPPDPVLGLYVPSTRDLERDLRGLVAAFSEGVADDFDLLEMLPGDLGAMDAILDRDRPMAAALRLPPGMPVPMFSAVVPLRNPSMDADAVAGALGTPPLLVRDGYAVIGTDNAYVPTDGPSMLMSGVGNADATLRLDVATLWAMLGPFVDMMVQMALTPPVEDGQAPPTSIDPEAIDSMLAGIRMIGEGVTTLEVLADVNGSSVDLGLAARLAPDGPLALGPQGTLDDVWAMSGALDPDAALLAVSGMDLTNFVPFAESLMGMFEMMADNAEAPGASNPMEAILQLQSQGRRLMELNLRPYVVAFDAATEPWAHWVASMDDTAGLADEFRAAFAVLAPLGLVTSWEEPGRTNGFDTARVDLDFDMSPYMAEGELGEDEAAQLEAIFEKWLSTLTVATADDHAVVALDPDADRVTALLAAVDGGRGAVPPALVEARAWARGAYGADPLGVASVDLSRLITSIASMMGAEMSDAPMPAARLQGAGWIDGDWLAGRINADVDALAAVFGFMNENFELGD